MKTVFWISRHEMTPNQRADLERALGDHIRLDCWKDSVKDLAELDESLERADVVAAVLPMGLLAQLVNRVPDKPVLQAVSGRKPTGRTVTLDDGRREQEFLFDHLYWEQILHAEFRTQRL